MRHYRFQWFSSYNSAPKTVIKDIAFFMRERGRRGKTFWPQQRVYDAAKCKWGGDAAFWMRWFAYETGTFNFKFGDSPIFKRYKRANDGYTNAFTMRRAAFGRRRNAITVVPFRFRRSVAPTTRPYAYDAAAFRFGWSDVAFGMRRFTYDAMTFRFESGDALTKRERTILNSSIRLYSGEVGF